MHHPDIILNILYHCTVPEIQQSNPLAQQKQKITTDLTDTDKKHVYQTHLTNRNNFQLQFKIYSTTTISKTDHSL